MVARLAADQLLREVVKDGSSSACTDRELRVRLTTQTCQHTIKPSIQDKQNNNGTTK